jgi:hypothetical protein
MRFGTARNEPQYCSTSARPRRSNARRSGRFSSREIVARGQAIQHQLEHRVAAQRVGVVAVLVPGGDHQHAEPDDLRQAMHNPLRRARVHQAVRQSVRQAQPVLDFAQRQQAPFRRHAAAVKASNHSLALNR